MLKKLLAVICYLHCIGFTISADCGSHACENGECTNVDSSNPFCSCNEGWSGQSCDLEGEIHLSCNPSKLSVAVDRSLIEATYPGESPTLYLTDESCTLSSNDTFYYAEISYNDCNTTLVIDSGVTITFVQNIQEVIIPISQAGSSVVITRQSGQTIQLSCHFPAVSVVSASFSSAKQNGIDLSKELSLAFEMEIFKTSSYEEAYTDDEFPVNYGMGDKIYVQISVNHPKSPLIVLAKSCWVSISPLSTFDQKYYLFEDNCPRDSTYDKLSSSNTTEQRFSFDSFAAYYQSQRYSTFYVHCSVIACRMDDPNSNCLSDTCSERRKRRDTSKEGFGEYDSILSSAGRINLTLKNDEKDIQYNYFIAFMVGSFSLAIVIFIVGVVRRKWLVSHHDAKSQIKSEYLPPMDLSVPKTDL